MDFAATAWRVATGPVMAPGYVRFHSRILDARLGRNNWDGSMTATVTLATPWTRPLASSPEWQRGAHWRNWPVTRDFGTDDVTYHEPAEQDLTRSAYAMTSVRLAFSLPDRGLPTPPPGPTEALEITARKAVAGMVEALNHIVTPVIQAMD